MCGSLGGTLKTQQNRTKTKQTNKQNKTKNKTKHSKELFLFWFHCVDKGNAPVCPMS